MGFATAIACRELSFTYRSLPHQACTGFDSTWGHLTLAVKIFLTTPALPGFGLHELPLMICIPAYGTFETQNCKGKQKSPVLRLFLSRRNGEIRCCCEGVIPPLPSSRMDILGTGKALQRT